VANFEMNDKCAAGTGRFLENMALALDLNLEQTGPHALEASGKGVVLSSMCTVFCGIRGRFFNGTGEDSRRVALGIHQSIVNRVCAVGAGSVIIRFSFLPVVWRSIPACGS